MSCEKNNPERSTLNSEPFCSGSFSGCAIIYSRTPPAFAKKNPLTGGKCPSAGKEALQADKPDSVGPRRAVLPFIQVRPRERTLSAYPLRQGSWPYRARNPAAAASARCRSLRQSKCTWHFNPRGLSAPAVARRRRALLPHVFTLALTPRGSGRYGFCDTFCAPALASRRPTR